MLRHQILIEPWQLDAIRKIADDAEISYSEAHRFLMNKGILNLGNLDNIIYPKHRDTVSYEARKAMEKKMKEVK